MNITLSKPICFFDLETTGVNISKDRIVEISVLKIFQNGNKESRTWLVNPEITISKEVSNIHGITNEMVVNASTFKEESHTIYGFLKGCDLAGFNSDRFDIPLLVEELLRAEVSFDFKNVKTVDVQTIFHKMEARTLSAALKFYCEEELKDAHSAQADTKATHDVLLAQLDRYNDLEPNIDFLNKFSTRRKTADFAGFVVFDKSNEMCFGFGKHKGQKVTDILEKEPGYFGWVLNADFPRYTKKILTEVRLQSMNTKD